MVAVQGTLMLFAVPGGRSDGPQCACVCVCVCVCVCRRVPTLLVPGAVMGASSMQAVSGLHVPEGVSA